MNIELRLRKAVSGLDDSVAGREPRPLPSSRRVMLVRIAFATLMIGLVALVAIPMIRNSSVAKIGTAHQPKKGDSAGAENDSGGPPTEEGSAPAPAGARQGKAGAAPGEGTASGSKGGPPEGTILRGFEIAFNGREGISLMKADGSGLRVLRAGADPGWSADGKLIAFSDNLFGGDIQFMNTDGTDLQMLRARGSSPTWSPDGGQLAFNWECDAQYGSPCVSADGSKKDCGPECGIGVVARDGSGPRRLGNGIWPDWGPDGRIVFTDGIPTGPCNNRGGVGGPKLQCALPIWVMNSDGSGRTKLPIDRAISPTWSQDGRRIAYHTGTDGVFIANADGSGIVKVAPADFTQPSWSPDGLWLAMTGYTDQEMCTGCHSIYLRSIDGSTEKRLTSTGYDFHPAFSPRR